MYINELEKKRQSKPKASKRKKGKNAETNKIDNTANTEKQNKPKAVFFKRSIKSVTHR